VRRPPDEEEEEQEEEPVRRRRPIARDDDEQEEDDYEERPRPKKKKGLKRKRALEKVRLPATIFQVLGGIGLAFSIMTFVSNLILRRIPMMGAGGGQPDQAMWIGQLIGGVIAILWYLAIFQAAGKMKNLESYRSSLVVSIVALFPCFCLFVALPFGIWSLVVINSPDVRPYFKS
jgi:hypothetical protein